jgi:hypothetical protein
MGNRGLLHNDRKEIVRHSQLKRWIYCKLEFKGWQREVMRPGHYTELFFLDEATALAAGHRPCMECQRERATEFKRIWNEVNEPVRTMVEMDEVLRQPPRPHYLFAKPDEIPDGVMTVFEGQCYLIKQGKTHRWSFGGYQVVPLETEFLTIITPLPIMKIIAAGFKIDLP